MIAAEIPPYRIINQIGAGRMGEVYRTCVVADGQRFLVNNVVEDTASQPITVTLNWTAQLKK